MATRNSYPRAGYPLSYQELKKSFPDGPQRRFLEKYATRDMVYYVDDFDQDTINLDRYVVAGGPSGTTTFAINVQEDGVIRGTTGTTDDAAVSLIGPKIYYGDRNCGMECRLKIDVVTGLNFEVGFLVSTPTSDAGGITDIDTPAFTATAADDAALLAMDTDQTLTTMAFCTRGVTAGQTATKTNLVSTTVPTAATFLTVRIEILGDDAFCWVNGILEAQHNTIAAGHIEGGTALAPWIYCRTRNTTSKLMDVDYLALWKDRNV